MILRDDPLGAVEGKYLPAMQTALEGLRDLLVETARETDAVNQLVGSLKWGQPSYEAVEPKTGSPLRLDRHKGSDSHYALYFICTTSLVEAMRQHYGDVLTFEGNRAIVFDINEPVPKEAVKHCMAMALTYRLGNWFQ